MSAATDIDGLAAIAHDLLGAALPDGYTVAIVKAATCHPDRPASARELCKSCYQVAWMNRTLNQHPVRSWGRSSADFVADFRLLRAEGHTRDQIAERLGMTRHAVNQAHRRAVRNGLLEPDRRTA
jgi:hypothetical protein